MFTLLFSLRDCFRSRAVLQAEILASCGTQKFHFSGFQRYVTLLHSDRLVGEITISQRQVSSREDGLFTPHNRENPRGATV
jgi:hypothetical protein